MYQKLDFIWIKIIKESLIFVLIPWPLKREWTASNQNVNINIMVLHGLKEINFYMEVVMERQLAFDLTICPSHIFMNKIRKNKESL